MATINVIWKKPPKFNLFTFKRQLSATAIRSGPDHLIYPTPRSNVFSNSFQISGTKFWNSIPDFFKYLSSLKTFKDKFLSYLLTAKVKKIFLCFVYFIYWCVLFLSNFRISEYFFCSMGISWSKIKIITLHYFGRLSQVWIKNKMLQKKQS